jgi:hypothetical protein
MTEETKPDLSCVPYRRKGLYFALTLPIVGLMLAVFVYLWTFSFLLSFVLLLFYGATCYFQAYCCAYQDCPYVGGFCPAIAGIMPASLLAKLLYSRKDLVRSKKRFERSAVVAIFSWLGLIAFPLFWLAKLGPLVVAGYVAFHLIDYAIFVFTICPACAIRDTCPGGKLHRLVPRK